MYRNTNTNLLGWQFEFLRGFFKASNSLLGRDWLLQTNAQPYFGWSLRGCHPDTLRRCKMAKVGFSFKVRCAMDVAQGVHMAATGKVFDPSSLLSIVSSTAKDRVVLRCEGGTVIEVFLTDIGEFIYSAGRVQENWAVYRAAVRFHEYDSSGQCLAVQGAREEFSQVGIEDVHGVLPTQAFWARVAELKTVVVFEAPDLEALREVGMFYRHAVEQK
ncbi:MAG: hypothetical protein ABH814_00480 [bacterium]